MSKTTTPGELFLYGLGATALIISVVATSFPYQPKQCVTARITGTERIAKKNDSYYLVFTEDLVTGEAQTFRNSDEWFAGKFNSSDYQSKFSALAKEGSEVTFSVSGWRYPALSMYQNIYQWGCNGV